MAFLPIYDTNPLRHIRRPWVAWALLAANILVFFIFETGFTGEPSEASVYTFGLVPAVFTGAVHLAPTEVPGWATIVTYAFLHGDFWHLAGNMIFLWVLADNVEDALGHVRYLLFYGLCAAAAGYAYVLSDPGSQAPVIGASGALAGNVSAYLMLTPRAKMWALLFGRIPLHLSAYWVLGVWIVFQIGTAFLGGDEQVAWWSHVGGLAAGAVLVIFMRQRGVPLFERTVPTSNVPPPEQPEALPPGRNDGRGPWG